MLLVISSCNTQGYHNLYATKPLAIVMDGLAEDLRCYYRINPFNNQTIRQSDNHVLDMRVCPDPSGLLAFLG